MADKEQQTSKVNKKQQASMADKEQQASKLADPILLGKIDKLFACNVGEYVNLPQLVVIGDQSSGKSSVLEGLTELPFPRDSGLCTRFATQIIFKRAPVASVNVSIHPAPDASDEHKEKVRAWHMDIQKLDATAFANIMKEVPATMGLSMEKDKPPTATFSDDVLCIAIQGPKEVHLSFIDVPGIFKNTTPGVTTKNDIAMVRKMVQAYMGNPRSVMIAVVPANVDIATQEILEMAREVDPQGQRTIGVLTKPDLVDKGAEANVLDLLSGKGSNAKLGWSIVRNLGQQHLNDGNTDRQSLEENFFRFEKPWDSIDKDRVGVAALQKRLQQTLTTHIRREFPKVRVEISKLLLDSKKELELLGADRGTKQQQINYLLDIATEFRRLTSAALATQYSGEECFDNYDSLRILTRLANRDESFANDLQSYGHKYMFQDEGAVPETVARQPHENVTWAVIAGQKAVQPQAVDTIRLRQQENHADIEDILSDQKTVKVASSSGIINWIEKVHLSTRGNDLGTFNGAVVSMAMREQSSKWDDLTMAYTSDVVAMAHFYIIDLLTYLCADENVRARILAVLLDSLLDRYRQGLNHAKFLLKVERESAPQTVNHYFNENLEAHRKKRKINDLSSKTIDDCTHGKVVRMDDLMNSKQAMSNTEHTVREIHDILRAYYKVARKRFVDNICMQAARYYLVSGPESPLLLFEPKFVINLTEDKLEEIAGEDEELKNRRKQLVKEIEDLEAGRKILL